MKLCSDRYRFKISKALTGDVQYDAVIKTYCHKAVDENCVIRVQFIQELIDYRDYYHEVDCQLTGEEICDIIDMPAIE